MLFDKMNGKGHWIGHLFITFLSTLAGVLCAFLLNEWNEGVKLDKTKSSFLSNIMDEIKNNKEEFILFYESFQQVNSAVLLYDSLLEHGEELVFDQSTREEIKQKSFGLLEVGDNNVEGHKYTLDFDFDIHLPDFSDVAYESAKVSQVVNSLPFSCLYDLETIYNNQANIGSKAVNMIDLIQSGDFERIMFELDVILQFSDEMKNRYDTYFQNKNCI